MNQVVQFVDRLNLTAKTVTLLVLFSAIPMVLVGWIAFNASNNTVDQVGQQFEYAAVNLADTIDRNLFERYGDVQAFGLNTAVTQRNHWYVADEDKNPIVQVMNQYVDTYDIYFLTLLVDLKGRLIAVNTKDADGKPIETKSLYATNYSQAHWFQALKAKSFTTKMPFTAPGNEVSSGTFVEDLLLDKDVQSAYPGKDGLVLGFSAPVYQNGQVVAYWSNRAKFSLVEDIVKAGGADLKTTAGTDAEITVLDSVGRVIVDYDPIRTGSDKVVRDFDVLMKLNLAEKGVPVAQKAVNGQRGYENALHHRKQIMQASGYAHLKGAMGFPGMNWSILVRVPLEQAAASSRTIQRNVLITVVVSLLLAVPLGLIVGRIFVRQLSQLIATSRRLAAGDLTARSVVSTQDELGQLAQAFNEMAQQIQANLTHQEQVAKEMTRIKTALDNTTTNVMVCDRAYTIVYVNKASVDTLRRREAEIRQIFPGFAVDKVVGSCVDAYHKNPSHQRQLLDNPKNLPYHAEIKLGPLTLDLNAAAIMNDKGEYVGNVVEWSDVTAQMKAQSEVDKLITAAASGQLSERINAEEFEGFFKTLSQGVNKMLDAVVMPLHEAQQVLTALAANDLTKTMTGNYQGEFEQMKASLNSALGTLSTALTTVREGAESVTAGTEQITKGNEDLAQRTSEQASALEETSASMEEMTLTMKQNADNAKQANQLAIAARNIADKGGSVTTRAVEAMGEINKSSKKIADIITVIDEIAFQTNLLALNAAVEAARAGEHGRGFAVVAAEVRNLAQRSATAAKEIKGLINESIQRVNDGSELVNQSGKTLEEIVSSVKRVTDIIAEITAASQEQASGIDQVNKAIMQMDEATQENAALVEETTSASQSMKEQARELMSQVEVFKVSDRREASCVKRLPAATAAAQAGEALGSGTKYASRDTLHGSRSHATPKPAGVAAGLPVRGMQTGNGKDRRRTDDEFEEF
jgi:methyl-accepting chemotaxis protein